MEILKKHTKLLLAVKWLKSSVKTGYEYVKKTPFPTLWKTISSYFVLVIVSILMGASIMFVGSKVFGSLFQHFSPWSEQRQDIANKNNVRDAYSAIIGSDVGLVSQNGIMKWFSNKEATEIDISIPKIINYSDLFDDESGRDKLEGVLLASINEDIIKQSTDDYQVIYDGSPIGGEKDGEEFNTLKDLRKEDKKKILNDLRLKLRTEKNIEFKKWQKVNGLETVKWSLNKTSDTEKVGSDASAIVTIEGIFEDDGFLFTHKDYNIYVTYEYIDSTWELMNNSLKVKKVK